MNKLFLVLLLGLGLLTGCASETTDASSTTADANETVLEGRWRSADDSKSVIVVSGESFISIYDGSVVSEETVEYFATCPDVCMEGLDMACFMVKGEFDATCYAIVSVTENELQYSMLGGPGNTLTYRKIIE